VDKNIKNGISEPISLQLFQELHAFVIIRKAMITFANA